MKKQKLKLQQIRWFEELSFSEWPALETLYHHGWILRFAGGYTKRANSVCCHEPETNPDSRALTRRISEVEALFNDRGVKPTFKLTAQAPKLLDALLAARGYAQVEPSLVLTLNELPSSASPGAVWFENLDPAWGAVFAEWKALDQKERTLFERLTKASSGEVYHGLMKDTQGHVVACATGVLDRGWLGVLNVHTVPDRRGQGWGKAMMQALLAEGKRRGATGAYLQVVADNHPATRLYRGLGFQKIYTYHYRVKTSSHVMGRSVF